MNRTLELPYKVSLRRIPTRMIILALGGLTALIFYASWWFQSGRLTSPWLLLGFIAALCYGAVQLIGSWVLYIAAHYSDRRRL